MVIANVISLHILKTFNKTALLLFIDSKMEEKKARQKLLQFDWEDFICLTYLPEIQHSD